MKIGVHFPGMDISARGMAIQRQRMDLIAENIANADTTRAEDGRPYRRKSLLVLDREQIVAELGEQNKFDLKTGNPDHYVGKKALYTHDPNYTYTQVLEDATPGDVVYMPNHPDADTNGYVEMPNVDIVTEMVEMIKATRGFEANITAFESSKEIAKSSLDI
jgi:flagellar basal-body rod protein FlgC